MSTTTNTMIERESDPYSSPETESGTEYQSISKAAVASLVFAILGLLAIWEEAFVILPFLGICFGFVARSSLKKYPDELIGRLPATFGLITSLVLFIGSIGRHSYEFATEVPEGYQRISFPDLKPKSRAAIPYSPIAEELDGKKVFIKGYVRPGDKRKNLRKFILVGDFGQCCFGGNPKMTDIVAIDIVIDKTVDYGWGLRKITGTFRFNPQPVGVGEKDIPGVYYQIEADSVQ